ncbi:unnamed protein product [Auanema sp. JU1783]|nr:unnamed protein product [Auanema sp. JU1783]
MLFQLLLYSTLAIAVTPTHRLKQSIINRKYDMDVRPVLNLEDVTTVTVTPNKYVLLMMDQQQETMRFLQEFLITWEDPHLTWNRTDYGYKKDWIKIPESIVWTPDVIFQSAIDREGMVPLEERMIDLKYDGTLRQSNPSVIELPCSLRIEDFPFDVQKCSMSIGSWNFDDSQILMKTSTDRILPVEGRFEGNSEWELVGVEAVDEKILDAFTQGLYSVTTYKVTLKRKPVYYVLVIQAPTFIVSTLTIFGLFTPFSQHSFRKEKVTLGLNMFVSISMMLNLVSDMMPKASRLPLLGNYILAEIFVCGSAVLVSIFILTLHQKCHTRALKPPQWLLRVILFRCSVKIEANDTSRNFITENTSNHRPFGKIQDTLKKTSQIVQEELQYCETVDKLRKLWLHVFDRLDLLCLILFQLFNIIASALFMR